MLVVKYLRTVLSKYGKFEGKIRERAVKVRYMRSAEESYEKNIVPYNMGKEGCNY